MSKVNIIYWSGTGNTEAMANAIFESAKKEGAEVKLINVADASVEDVLEADVVALGCPAMGAEELEESQMEPFVAEIEGKVKGKKMALFGSYEWADGEWMETWYDRMFEAGCDMISDGLAVYDAPDDEAIAKCSELGAKLAI